MKTSAVSNITKRHRRQQDVPKSDQKVTGPAPYRQSQFPKWSAYSANKKRTTSVKKEYEKKSSPDQHDKKTKSVGTYSIGKAYKKEKEETAASSGNQISPRKGSIFVTPSRDYKDIAEDVIHADCMNHGYRIEKTVGEGAYAKVKLAEVLNSKLARNADMCEHIDMDGNFKVAIKVIEARSVPREFLKKFLPRELENHCPLPVHKNVVRVFEQFRTADRYYVVMEYCSNGDLLDLINCRISKSCKGLGEDRARSLFKMMVGGMNHIHANGIVHRDLKCENILLDKANNIKVTDFGFSCRFTPGESSLLKTSCGSYAYTAPEVIKLKPYDGTKSDVWSLGIILFAMLNGRLPFNDAQLNDLEEDMKMQRLRFERTVSFESMVLVRRILQFNPSNRPTMAEILNDPWLMGKRLIPRQQTTPKWKDLNGHHQSPRPDCGSKDGVHGNTIYYKATLPEYGDEATITVNHEKNETVTLKSRTGSKKNIWINGPRSSQRPNTWPNADKKTNQKPSSRPPKGASKPRARGSSARPQKNRTIVVVKQAESKKGAVVPSNRTKSPSVSQKTITRSKCFLGKLMTGKENDKPSTDSTNCVCCKAETKCRQPEMDDDDFDLGFLDSDVMQTMNAENDDFRFPSPIKNVPTISQPEPENSVKIEKHQSNGTKTTSLASRGRKSMIAIRKSPTKATETTRHGAKSARVATTKQTTTTPDFSKNTNVVHYMVNGSTSPAERVKYFRDRLMKLYGNDRMDKQAEGSNGLPPLMVQSLNSQRGTASSTLPSSATNVVIKSPTQSSSYTPPPGAISGHQTLVNAWRTGLYKTGTTVKPVQRVIVHSSIT